MSILRSRTADPLPDAPRGSAIGTWGIWLTMIVLATFVAGFAAAALYLHSGQPSWPPEGISRPPRTYALVALAIGIAVAGLSSSATRRMAAGDRGAAAATLLLAALGQVATVVVLTFDLRATGFRWDEHAFTSVHWVLTSTAMTLLAIGGLLLAAVLVQTLVGLLDAGRHLELLNTAIYLWSAVAASAVLLGLVHLLPTVGGGP